MSVRRSLKKKRRRIETTEKNTNYANPYFFAACPSIHSGTKNFNKTAQKYFPGINTSRSLPSAALMTLLAQSSGLNFDPSLAKSDDKEGEEESMALLRRSVATDPGLQRTMETPLEASSIRRELKKPFRACFVAV